MILNSFHMNMRARKLHPGVTMDIGQQSLPPKTPTRQPFMQRSLTKAVKE